MSDVRGAGSGPLPGLTTSAVQDEAHIGPNWELRGELIDGVRLSEVRNIVTGNGATTELWRREWSTGMSELAQVIHVALEPGAVSAWHLHRSQSDGVFVVGGSLRLVLYDPREGSPTAGKVDVLHLSNVRPTFVLIPTDVWHGLEVLGHEPARFVNCFDACYDYDDPDEWRLPHDSDEIPYRFS